MQDQGVLKRNVLGPNASGATGQLGRKIGIIGRLFGCRHRRLTRPFSNDGTTYMACVDCGARRQVDMERFQSSGPFYYPPSVAFDR
ncbi:MAG: hypothetical protein ACK4S4_00525 [Pyrinomonadaceae bacterium]